MSGIYIKRLKIERTFSNKVKLEAKKYAIDSLITEAKTKKAIAESDINIYEAMRASLKPKRKKVVKDIEVKEEKSPIKLIDFAQNEDIFQIDIAG
jgi:hypothetical protein